MDVETTPAGRAQAVPFEVFERFDEIADSVGRTPCLLLDFDGTLARIVPRPRMARLEPGLREVLAAWAERVPVAVVSGRDVKDVRKRVGVEDAVYVGDHGFVALERGREVLASVLGEDHLAALDRAAQGLEASLEGVEGAWVERKRCTLAVHTRQVAPGHKGEVEARVDQALEGVRGLRKGRGKEVVEVRPDVAWDKGRAVLELLKRWDDERVRSGEGSRWVPVVVGDDESDEAMFEAVGDRGVTVFVGEEGRTTAARYRVADPARVREFLARLGGRVGLA